MKKQSIYLLIILLLCTSLFTGCGKNVQNDDNTVYVKTQKVTYGAVNYEDTYSGTVKGRYETNLSFQVGGKILSRNINVGDKVSAGDVLMAIDDRDVKQNVNAYAAQVASAKSQMDLAQSNLARFQKLYAANAISAQELDQYQNAYNNAVAAYDQANAQLDQSENSLGYTELIINNDGVISAINAEVGQVVAAGQTVATIVQDGDREIEIAIPENKIQSISVGQNAIVTFWALNNTQVQGVVREISPVADPVARTYKVRIAMSNMPQNVQLGMTASVAFMMSGVGNTVTLPLSAIYQTDDTPQVWLVDGDMKLQLKEVNIVAWGKDDVEVTGLNQDDTVVTAGVHKLYEGEAVKLVDGDAL